VSGGALENLVELSIQTTGTIRSAAAGDATALARLFVAVGDPPPFRGTADLAGSLARGHLIVLDLGSESIGAAAFVMLECTDDREVHAHIQFLVVHPAFVGTGSEERLITAVLALCEASGCRDLDLVPSARHEPRPIGGRSS
jgi:ribosomal protein S18 acetylase RimI-like enzyme